MAEGDGLLNRYTSIPRIVGSNPIPSSRYKKAEPQGSVFLYLEEGMGRENPLGSLEQQSCFRRSAPRRGKNPQKAYFYLIPSFDQ